MKLLYQAIQSLFKSSKTLQVFHNLNLCPPEFIDLYNAQPEDPESFEFTTPAIFIDYSILWSKAGTTRIGTLTLDFHILTDPTPETDNLTESLSGLEKVDYYETVSDLLEDLSTAETSGLILTSERPVATDYFNYHTITFTCTISRRRTKVIGEVINNLQLSSKQKKYIL